MHIFKWVLFAALVAALAMPFTRAVVAADFAEVLDTPAMQSPLAVQGILTGLAQAGERLVTVGQRGHILYSDDAGKQWRQAQVPVSSDLVAVHFPTPKLGWAVGHDGVVLHSRDAGETWNRQLDGRHVGAVMLQHYQKLLAIRPDDSTFAALVEESQRMSEQGADKPFLDVWFESERVGYIVGAFNLIFRTDDGGRNWTPLLEQLDNPGMLHLYAIRPIGAELYIVGEQGLVLKLDQISQRFTAVPTPYNGTYFGITGKDGVVLVFGLRGNVYRSTDAGQNWSKVEIAVPLSVTAGTVTRDGWIVLLSQAGHVLVSRDDGATFHLSQRPQLSPVSAVVMTGQGHESLVLAGVRGVRVLPVE
ncbi:YCF48-related protein [Pseudomonas sp. LjRoot71]|uniref:WD40/YVTN/BNR-like repeat-containing protein n=1 Tax=unclassified Pseudomonas TaxID=196821 RepID=UPI0025FE2199|nr:YCF48-related protein [Pseudomonas sp. UBA7530]